MSNYLAYFLAALFASHLLADFAMQSDAVADNKKQKKLVPYVWHGLTHAVLVYVAVGCWRLWFLAIILGISHVVVDFVKELLRPLVAKEDRTWAGAVRSLTLLASDQAVHTVVLLLAAIWCIAHGLRPTSSAWFTQFGETYVHALTVVAGFVLAVPAGAMVIDIISQPIRESAKLEATGIASGGRMVGLLERTLVFILVATGNFGSVGFLTAAKSIFRFPEVSDKDHRNEAEYVMIGTLMSFTWAIAVTLLTVALLKREVAS